MKINVALVDGRRQVVLELDAGGGVATRVALDQNQVSWLSDTLRHALKEMLPRVESPKQKASRLRKMT